MSMMLMLLLSLATLTAPSARQPALPAAARPESQPAAADPPPTRGRDPWVFRCIFEDRSRMVIIAPAKDAWIAFNPNTCTMQKVWLGGMEFRGKVWDFSQDNCAAAKGADVLMSDQPFEQLAWAPDRVSLDASGVWHFEPGGTLTSSEFSLQECSRVNLAFDETSRQSTFKIQVLQKSTEAGKQPSVVQSFESTTHGSSQSDWQANLKELTPRDSRLQIRIACDPSGPPKNLRNLRLVADRNTWKVQQNGTVVAPVMHWRGYTITGNTRTVAMRYSIEIAKGVTVEVEQTLDLRHDDLGCRLMSEWKVRGLPEGITLVTEDDVQLSQDGRHQKIWSLDVGAGQ